MENICAGDNGIIRIMKKSNRDESMYRLSDRCLLYREAGQNASKNIRLLKNILTGQIVSLTEEEFSALSDLKNHQKSIGYVKDKGLLSLVETNCIVSSERNEYEDYQSLLRILRMMKKPVKGYENYILFPTTGCNARCVYCFEYDYVPKTMTEETALETAAFIARTRGNEPIRLKWFGGEPLAASSRIDLICRELENRQVNYTSSIVTNATLITPELAERACNLWHLKKAQVSLDGNRIDYEARKRYINPKAHHYEAAMEGIRLLLSIGTQVDLRCNYDRENLKSLKEFLYDIHQAFENQDIHVYFSPLYQELEKNGAADLIREIREIEDEAETLGIQIGKEKRKASFHMNFCMADDMERNVVIDPEGYLQTCEHLSEQNRYGNVRDGITDRERYEVLRTIHSAEKECERCPFLPECTTFFKKGCPMGAYPDCRGVKLVKTENSLHRKAKEYFTSQQTESP